jgi:oligopeptide transport system ATP-binding protein
MAGSASRHPRWRSSVAKGDPILEVEHLVKHFPIKSGLLFDREVASVKAVDDVSLTLHEGETLGLVGESGCGKSTLCRTIIQLLEPTAGSVKYRGKELVGLSRKKLRPVRREIQMIFQDPYASLNPRKRVGQIIGDPLELHDLASGTQLRREVQQLMDRVGLQPEHYNRYPHEFSGGQRQRIGIARALALRPTLIIADEPVSALDVSIQAQIINLLEDLQDEFNLSYIFVAHDLGVVRHVSDRIAVMYLGKLVERSPAAMLYERPIHPYSVALLSAVPIPDPKANAERTPVVLEGDVPSPVDPPSACRFHTRCPWATEICSEDEPPLAEYSEGQAAACHHPRNVDKGQISRTEVAPDSPESASDRLPDQAEPVTAATR